MVSTDERCRRLFPPTLPSGILTAGTTVFNPGEPFFVPHAPKNSIFSRKERHWNNSPRFAPKQQRPVSPLRTTQVQRRAFQFRPLTCVARSSLACAPGKVSFSFFLQTKMSLSPLRCAHRPGPSYSFLPGFHFIWIARYVAQFDWANKASEGAVWARAP